MPVHHNSRAYIIAKPLLFNFVGNGTAITLFSFGQRWTLIARTIITADCFSNVVLLLKQLVAIIARHYCNKLFHFCFLGSFCQTDISSTATSGYNRSTIKICISIISQISLQRVRKRMVKIIFHPWLILSVRFHNSFGMHVETSTVDWELLNEVLCDSIDKGVKYIIQQTYFRLRTDQYMEIF